jgi:hypothetical protein
VTTGAPQPIFHCYRRLRHSLAQSMRPRRLAMNPKIYCVFLAVLLAACGDRNSGVQKSQQQNYDVVQEGSSTGVTSTINGPGDTAPPLTSSTITGTNVDTTTNFTLPNTVTTATTTDQSGSIASTLRQTSGSLSNGYYPPRPHPRPRPPAQTTTTASTPTSTSVEGPPATDTTTTAPPRDEKKSSDQPPPPPTDTTATGTQG